ncbi:Protein TIC 214 [Diplonema papillatum]|nr:Protein TIC 214 [Diplonema papillatum]
MKTIIWASTVLCWLVPSTLASFAADACVASGEVPTATQPQLAAVLCCRDGDWCDSDIGGRCHGDSVGFAEASDVCASRAARMCTFAELSSGLCCDTGCGYDDLAAWYDNCVSGPCVHGTCSSTAESYTCTCDAGFTGENCDEELPTTSTAEPSQTFAPTPEPEGSRGELFGAHSFDFLIEEADRFKNRMINRTADAASDVMDKLGLEDMLVSITENGVLADLQEQVTEKLDTVFGEFFEGNGTIDFDVDEILEPLKEQAGSVMKSCKASPLPADPQARSARAQGTDRLKAILKDVFVPDKVGGTFVIGFEKQTLRTRNFAALAVGAGDDGRLDEAYVSVNGVMGHFSNTETGAADRETGAANRETGAANRETGAADRETRAADRETGAANRETGAADRETRAANRETRAANRETGAADRETRAANRETRAANRETGAADRETRAANRETRAADRETGAADRETGAADRETGAADRETRAADRETGAADRETSAADTGGWSSNAAEEEVFCLG